MRFRSRLPDGQECPVCGRSGPSVAEAADERAVAHEALGAKIDAMEVRLAAVADLELPSRAS